MFCRTSPIVPPIAIRIISVSGEKGQRSTLGRNRVFDVVRSSATEDMGLVNDYVPNCWMRVCCCHKTSEPGSPAWARVSSAPSDAVLPVDARYGLVVDLIEIYHINHAYL